MHFSITSSASLSLFLLTVANALTITSPSAGSSLDPTQPITVRWTSSSSDPSTFNLILDNSNANSLTKNKEVASSISTSSGSYVLSTAALMSYGTGFVFKAEDSTGNVLATSGSFSLAVDGSAVSTSDGQVSFHSTYTATPSSGASGSGSVSGSSFYAQTTGVTTITGTSSGSSSGSMTLATTSHSTGTANSTGTNGFTTSTTARSTSGTRSVASSAASATTSANAQPRLGGSSSQIAFSAAGILAGLVALLA